MDSVAGGENLARHLLCAVPQLQDPNFQRAVVLMLEHTDEGALGLVINNPIDTRVAEVATGLGLTWRGHTEDQVRLGGPVEPVRGWIIHDQAGWDPSADEVVEGVYLTTSLDPVQQVGRTTIGHPGSRFAFLLGYAGWAAAQLEGEIAAGSWVVVPIDREGSGFGVAPEFVLHAQPAEMWDDALRSIGVDPGRLVRKRGNVALA